MVRRRGTTYGRTNVRHALPTGSQAHGPIQGVIFPRDAERSRKAKPREFDDSHGGHGGARENGTLKILWWLAMNKRLLCITYVLVALKVWWVCKERSTRLGARRGVG